MHAMVSGYRLAEHALHVQCETDKVRWHGTRNVRRMFASVSFPISLHTAHVLARDYADIGSAWYWHTKTKTERQAQ